MKYTLEKVKEVVDLYKDKIKIHKNISYTGNLTENIVLFDEINMLYPDMFKTIVEVVYLLNNGVKEKFCPDGNMLTFKGYKHGYSKYCRDGKLCKELRLKNWEDNFERLHGVRKISDLPMMREKFDDPEWGKMCRKHQLETFQNKTGYDHPSKCPESIEKRKKNNLKKFGVEHHWKSKNPKLNGSTTRKQKYGTENIFTLPEVQKRAIEARNTKESKEKKRLTIEKNRKKKFEQKHEHFDDFNEEFFRKTFIKNGRFDLKACCDYFKIFYSWANYKKREFNIIEPNLQYRDHLQDKLYNFIRTIYKGEILYNKRTIISPQELDIYIPEKKLAIEFNGIYWHCSLYREKNYHQEKSKLCQEKGIRLIHIYEDEWNDEHKREIIKDIIKHALNIPIFENKIYARKCIVKEIENKDYNDFCNKYHIQGTKGAQVKLGLFYNNELVQIASFGKSRYDKKYEWEWIRGCPASNNNVIGGTSKLFKYFIRKYNPKSVLCYADFNKFDGKGYKECGFKFVKITAPDKFYFNVENNVRINRSPKHYKEYMNKVKAGEFLLLYGAGNLKFDWFSTLP